MVANSKIEWTHHTFNPWWGCVKVSPGCTHCYADTFAKRVGQKVWGADSPRRFFGDKHWDEPLKWDAAAKKAGERRRVFCASMADVFEARDDLVEPRLRLWSLIERTPNLDWLLLTKRPENIAGHRYPTANVWLGTTCEDQRRADERIPRLLAAPAAVHFLSVEPLIERVDVLGPRARGADTNVAGIDWIIVGGESGHGARPLELWWIRSLIAQGRDLGAAVFVKQLGARPIAAVLHDEAIPLDGITDPKGGDMAEWPHDLQIRQFPKGGPRG